MTKSQKLLLAVSQGLIDIFTAFTSHLEGKAKASQERRSEKGRVLFRRALDPQDDGVTFWYDKKTGVLRTRLLVKSTEDRWASIDEDGNHECSCPDFRHNGAFCKHLRALAGLTVKRTGRPLEKK